MSMNAYDVELALEKALGLRRKLLDAISTSEDIHIIDDIIKLSALQDGIRNFRLILQEERYMDKLGVADEKRTSALVELGVQSDAS
ncbi:hypothetical protein [Methylocystis parvus]|uniref:hypothetical protein n=1 Tax=Methylocystis parvus TaxID=134 RepID=UPI003C70B7F6